MCSLMADILEFPLNTERLGVGTCDEILERAKGKLKRVVVLGVLDDEYETEFFTGNTDDGSQVLWLIERLKFLMFEKAAGR